MEQKEIWNPIKGFEGLYEVSNLGRVRSLQRTIIQKNGIAITSKGRFKRIGINSVGYPCVTLCKMGKANNTPCTEFWLKHLFPIRITNLKLTILIQIEQIVG